MTRTILVVEDSSQARKILEMTFDGIAGVVVRAVATAEEALRQLAVGEICAVVTDLGLPKMSGFDLIEFLRSEESFVRLPVLVVSGETGEETRARALDSGADAFFAKPFYPSEVRGELLRLIGGAAASARQS